MLLQPREIRSPARIVPNMPGTLLMKEKGMLILTRRTGESLLVGAEIIVTVLGVKGNQVRIGIKAPATVSVLREEIVGIPRKEKPAA